MAEDFDTREQDSGQRNQIGNLEFRGMVMGICQDDSKKMAVVLGRLAEEGQYEIARQVAAGGEENLRHYFDGYCATARVKVL